MRPRHLVAALTVVALLTGGAAAPSARLHFVQRAGAQLTVGGKPFRFNGSNNYYLHYQSATARDNVIDKAAASGFDVLRTWGWFDTGVADGSDPTAGSQNGVYLQYWDGTGHPRYNDGPDGLERLDAVIARAKQKGVRLVIPFTNNWGDFGGMDKYVEWAGLGHHDDFYADPRIRGWFRDWITHVLTRVNPLTGLAYKDDPTVLTWELANEPRCVGSGRYPRSPECDTDTLTTWAGEMSAHIKSIDRKHLVSVGDEGFFNDRPDGDDWTRNGVDGVDTVALAKLPTIDVMSFHLYPDGWGKDAAWGTGWIRDHAAAARRIGKPSMLGEFGIRDKSMRNVVYQEWTNAAYLSGVNGALYWILSDLLDDGTRYGDFDGFTVYCPSPVCTTIGNFGQRMRGQRLTFPPVADDDTVIVESGQTASVRVTANDIFYLPALRVDPRTVRLGTPSAGGTFTAARDGTVTFVPAEGFAGRATITYTVADTLRRRSNAATLTVTVKPPPGEPLTAFDLESGVQGWGPASFNPDAGTVATTTEFHADGVQSLAITGTGGGWFGSAPATPLDLSARAELTLASPSGNGSFAISFQTGPASTWCQGDAVRDAAGGTFTLDLTEVAAGCPGINDVRAVNIYVGGGRRELIDAIVLH